MSETTNEWTCCGTKAWRGQFCPDCGAKRPAPAVEMSGDEELGKSLIAALIEASGPKWVCRTPVFDRSEITRFGAKARKLLAAEHPAPSAGDAGIVNPHLCPTCEKPCLCRYPGAEGEDCECAERDEELANVKADLEAKLETTEEERDEQRQRAERAEAGICHADAIKAAIAEIRKVLSGEQGGFAHVSDVEAESIRRMAVDLGALADRTISALRGDAAEQSATIAELRKEVERMTKVLEASPPNNPPPSPSYGRQWDGFYGQSAMSSPRRR